MASWSVKHYFSIIILLTVLFGACSGEEKLPEDVLTENEMTGMMIQIHLLEAKIGKAKILRDSSIVVYRHFEKELLKKRGIDSATYYRSFDYYSNHPESFSVVYVAVADSLMEMEAKEKLRLEEAEKQKTLQGADTTVVVIDPIKTDKELKTQIDSKPRLIRRSSDSSRRIKMRKF